MDMQLYVASRSSNPRFALETDNLISICHGGPDPAGDARSYAKDRVRATDEPAYIYRVELNLIGGYKIHKEVVSVALAK